jgi:hypothetical protein
VKGLARRLPFLENFPRENQNGVSATWKAISALCNGDDDRPANEGGRGGEGGTGRGGVGWGEERRGEERDGTGRGGERNRRYAVYRYRERASLLPRVRAKSSNENTTQARRARARALLLSALCSCFPRDDYASDKRSGAASALALLADMIIPSAEKRGRKAALIFLRRHSHCPFIPRCFLDPYLEIHTRVWLLLSSATSGNPRLQQLRSVRTALPFSRTRLDTRTWYSELSLAFFPRRLFLRIISSLFCPHSKCACSKLRASFQELPFSRASAFSLARKADPQSHSGTVPEAEQGFPNRSRDSIPREQLTAL